MCPTAHQQLWIMWTTWMVAFFFFFPHLRQVAHLWNKVHSRAAEPHWEVYWTGSWSCDLLWLPQPICWLPPHRSVEQVLTCIAVMIPAQTLSLLRNLWDSERNNNQWSADLTAYIQYMWHVDITLKATPLDAVFILPVAPSSPGRRYSREATWMAMVLRCCCRPLRRLW